MNFDNVNVVDESQFITDRTFVKAFFKLVLFRAAFTYTIEFTHVQISWLY